MRDIIVININKDEIQINHIIIRDKQSISEIQYKQQNHTYKYIC